MATVSLTHDESGRGQVEQHGGTTVVVVRANL